MAEKKAVLQPLQELGGVMANEPGARREASLQYGLYWLSIPIFIIAIGMLAIWRLDVNWNPPLLIPSLNIIFGVTCTFFVFILATKSYLAEHSRTVLFLGCAMLAAGLGVLAGALYIVGHNVNMNMAIVSSMMCLSGLCNMGAAMGSLSPGLKRLRSGWQLLLASYLAIIAIFVVMVVLVQYQLWPAQYINGAGTTFFGVVIDGMTVVLMGLSGILLMLKRTGDDAYFRSWYGMGLILIAAGFMGVALQTALGDPLNWAGRLAEYLGSVYILVALVSSIRQSGEWLLPIEKALNESEEKFQVLAETSSVMFGLYQGENIVYVNNAAETLTGYSKAELLTMKFWDFMHPEYREMAKERGLARQRGEAARSKYDVMLLTKNGETRWAELTSGRIMYGGKPAGIATIVDITERKRAEEALEEKKAELEAQAEELETMNEELQANNNELSEVTRSLQDSEGLLREANERFDLVLNKLTDYFAICDSDWRYLYVNEAYAQNLRKSREGLLGQCVWDIIPQAVGTLNYENCLKTAEDRIPRTWTSSIIFSDRVLEYRTFAWNEGVAILARDITKEKRAEMSVLESERRYRSLFENIQEGFYLAKMVFDEQNKACDFIYLDVNPAFERIMGRGREQMLGRRATEVVPDIAPHWIDAFSQVVMTGTPMHYSSYSNVFKKHFDVFVFRPAEGQFAALVMDVTEREQTEEALRESEERYRTFFENNIDAVLITEPDGSVDMANAEACRIFGMTEEEIKQAGREGVVDLSDPRLKPALEERERTGKFRGELNYRRKDGTIFPGEVSTSFYKDKDGRVKTAMIIRDISERKRAEVALEKYRLFSDNTRDVVLFVRRDGCILEANEAAVKAYGYSYDELLSMSIYDLRASSSSQLVDNQMDKAYETGILFEAIHSRRDGSLFPVEVSSQGMTINGEKVLLSVIRDITERKRAEKELLEAKAQAELYLDLMGHDISNMHQIAMGQLELAQDVIKTDGKLEATDLEMVDNSLIALERSARLIDNVRKLQKIRSDEVKNKEISLDEMLSGVVNQFGGLYPEKSIKLDAGAGPHMVMATELLRDVFTNLVGNAIKHSNGSNVDISIKLDDVKDNGKNYYKVSIEDNGPGIPDDMKDKIFNRLQRGETKARGTGLGLYLVKALVDDFHGKVWVEDRVKGDHSRGSRFIVIFPAANSEAIEK